MSPQWHDPLSGEEPPHPLDVICEILRDVGSLSRLIEMYYLVQEPGLLDIVSGLSALSDDERAKLQTFLERREQLLLRLREDRKGALVLEWREGSQSDTSA